MDFLGWTAATGGLLLMMSLASGWISRSPVSTFGLYLAAGILCGPWALNLLQVDVVDHSVLVGRVTEIAMAASLFITGLKLRLPFKTRSWRMGARLAFPAMLLTVGGVTAAAHYMLGFDWPLALAFGAIVAPTDPVLASLISVNDASDNDDLRVALSSEAGMNDGSALPILILAMMLIGSQGSLSGEEWRHWALVDVVWALLGGLGIGFVMGRLVGLLATLLRSKQHDVAPNDFLALALIALSYAAAQSLEASGFLAAFAAGVGLRRAEMKVINRHPPEEISEHENYPPAEELVNPNQRHTIDTVGPAHSVGLVVGDALAFGDIMERIFAAAIVIVLGITLAQHWDFQGLLMAAVLFLVIRPVSVWIVSIGTGIPSLRRWLLGWLGIRGIGSINYIAYAYTHGLGNGPDATRMVDIAFTVIAASVIVHGITVTPLLNLRQARKAAKEERRRQEQEQREAGEEKTQEEQQKQCEKVEKSED
ncbi:sodium:proton antiporter [Chimaeribacter arupi]|uniref:Sodium:proton antiporter n=1 Tax=Chimaeribacter arupi TaxID=2060066 RepID=A0A2N5EMI4_9GAMM|nr:MULTISPECIES: sodium:proton antiporter [Yersiniaceae]MDV5139737.1 sodium:proton antiporter [Chimaeribacter arupi]PLR33561.1 sodium:proton antiporter [Chimaeribacter arupi]PLR46670.1 sodium:proton antiporter [Chimaeribacter arupi]PLR49279.1 sodium:proton antiporter [Chimaeribacter arupi]